MVEFNNCLLYVMSNLHCLCAMLGWLVGSAMMMNYFTLTFDVND